MKLFRHYKNKPYKYVGEAVHTETRERVVVYETRYENDVSQVWVRPKSMFFESVEIDGKVVPRFGKVDLEFEKVTEISSKHFEIIGLLMKQIFGEWDPKWFHSTFDHQKDFFLLVASIEGKAVGFKLGYEISSTEFYSWLGGVLPEFRGIGIAKDLLDAQHEWCRQKGYKKIETKTQNRFRDMLLLNIRAGFDVVGYHDTKDGPKILLEKNL